MKKILYLLLFVLVLSSCSKKEEHNYEKLMAVLYVQNSAEVQALYYQGFNIAKEKLTAYLKSENNAKKPVVVVDIDETMLDNSPYEANNILNNLEFSKEKWKEWSDREEALALPGALDFALFAQENNVEVFYISNRRVNELEATISNLKKEGFPFADKEHVYLRTDEGSKKARRAMVSENHEIVLLIGDNLGDLSEIFENRSENNGKNTVEQFKTEFGSRFIVLPNPMYGSWENPFYEGKKELNTEEKLQLKLKKLRSFIAN